MRGDILAGNAEIQATEVDCGTRNPPVIREYLSATDEDRRLFEMTFKAYRHSGQLRARERWYGWKKMTMEQVALDVRAMVDKMREVSILCSRGRLPGVTAMSP